MVKLTDSRIQWMIKRKEEGRMSNGKIARIYDITPRRLQQLWAQYRSTGQMPTLSKPGRPKKPPDLVEEGIVIQAYEKHHVCAVILEHLIQKEYGVWVPHNKIHRYLAKHGYAARNPKKQKRRRWIRYEREHSMSLWHMDWFQIDRLRGLHKPGKTGPEPGKWLIAVQDDASRRIMGHGVFENATAKHSIEVLKHAIQIHGPPDSVITDKGPQFYAVDATGRGKKKGLGEFEEYLQACGVSHILARTQHPQTNGKIERFFLTLTRQIGYHPSMDGLVEWYNTSRPHMSLDLSTPEEAFWHRLSPERTLGTASQLLYQTPTAR